MTIIEAVQSGKRIRRKGFDTWADPSHQSILLNPQDILETDWEVETEKEYWFDGIDSISDDKAAIEKLGRIPIKVQVVK